jgi:hypothetical protein
MTPHQFIGLAARIAAVWLLLLGLGQAVSAWMMRAQPLPDPATGLVLLLGVLYVAAALGMWLFPMSLAHRLLPRTRFDDRVVLHGRQALTVACIVLGLALCCFRALPDLASFVTTAVAFIAAGMPVTAMPLERAGQGALGLAQGLLGYALVRGAASFTAWAMPMERLDDDRVF